MEEGLCYFHANPDKASELGKRGGRAKGSMGTPGASEYVARLIKNVDDVARLLALATSEISEVQAQQICGMMNVSAMRTGPRRYG